MSRYTNASFVPTSFEIHWLSIINSFVLVLLLTAFLMIIMLRVLKNDFARYMDLDDEALEEEEVRYHHHHHHHNLSYIYIPVVFLMPLIANHISLQCTFAMFFIHTVRLEAHSWRCISLSSKSGAFLCSCWNRKSAFSIDSISFNTGTHEYYFDDPTRLYFGGSCSSLRLDIHCRWIHGDSALPPNEREKLGPVHSCYSGSIPDSCDCRFWMGQLGGFSTWFHDGSPFHGAFNSRCSIHLHFLPLDRFWCALGQKLCQSRFQCTHPNDQSCSRNSNRNPLVPGKTFSSIDCRIPSLLGNLH